MLFLGFYLTFFVQASYRLRRVTEIPLQLLQQYFASNWMLFLSALVDDQPTALKLSTESTSFNH